MDVIDTLATKQHKLTIIVQQILSHILQYIARVVSRLPKFITFISLLAEMLFYSDIDN
jgi:hypothetical protein